MNNKQETSTIARCSFCKKSQDRVNRLTAGPGGVYICDECVDLYRESLEKTWKPGDTAKKLIQVCSSCGTRCPASHNFCFNCGSRLVQET